MNESADDKQKQLLFSVPPKLPNQMQQIILF